ncbi:MAG TPA: DUF2235 domain-containing protein [Opitutaceae bacterium]|nr:DUF2235 domain-containing protein [Opitutaceae bacterium]
MPPRSKAPSKRDPGYTESYQIDLTPAPRPRHHVVLLDGTWNDENGKAWTNPLTGEQRNIVTNLVKLDRALAPDTGTQLVSYHRGIGNDETNTRIQQLFTGAFGADEICIRACAYAQLVLDHRPGDLISIFGFSRGAASARMLANDIARYGIPEKIDVTRRKWNGDYRIVRCAVPKGAKRTKAEVFFLGVWDTVGSFGLPCDIGPVPFGKINVGKELNLAPNVKRAVHCLALDEDRVAFAPVLLDGPPGVVEEVWFPGVHSDVGGGYGFDALGKITMAFMLNRWETAISAAGAPPLIWDEASRKAALPSEDDPIVRHVHEGRSMSQRPRKLAAAQGATPKVHASVGRLIAEGASFVAPSSEKTIPIARNYTPPNFTERDAHDIVAE